LNKQSKLMAGGATRPERSGADVLDRIRALKANVESVFMGKPGVVDRLVCTLFAGGHCLVEDVPGVGKTVLAKALAKSLDVTFRRIQFTPDLLPSDVLGVPVYSSRREEFIFKKGPVFANVILADEINRTTPRTQSSLLEAMSENQVSVDGISHPLPAPFIVIATQNPVEYEGTYPLPESQLDRFLMRVAIGYPSANDELRILDSQKRRHPLETLGAVMTGAEVEDIRRTTREVAVEDSVAQYVLDLVSATRASDFLDVGSSPRGSLALYRAAQAWALVAGRDYVVPDDVKEVVVDVLAHRIICKRSFAGFDSASSRDVVAGILEEVPVPA
jgi:MoxR-like ATPase